MDFEVVLEEFEGLRVGYVKAGERMVKAVEYNGHSGAVVHEWPTFRPWIRITFWCDKCNAKHVLERWRHEGGEWGLQLYR